MGKRTTETEEAEKSKIEGSTVTTLFQALTAGGRKKGNDNLTKPQEQLLRKLISFDSIELDDDIDKIKRDLYELFFVWKKQNQQEEVED